MIESAVASGPRMAEGDTSTTLKRKLTTWQIALLIIATAAPLGSIIGNVPLGLIMGGPGLPAAYLIAGAVLLCFALGYAKLVTAIPGEGAFYKYIKVVYGDRMGMGAAFVALLSYVALTASVASGVGYFTNLVLQGYGVDLGWQVWTLASFVIVSVLGRYSADIGAKLLTTVVLVEFLLLIALDVTIGAKDGGSALPLAVFSSANVLNEGFGVCLMVGFMSFIGFEAAALYAGEAKDPQKSIPRATIIAVVSVAIFYFLSCWLIVGTVGVETVQGLATQLEGGFVLDLINRFLGTTLSHVTNAMMCGSVFACYLSLHNASTRYAYIIAQNGRLPKSFAQLNQNTRAPAKASYLISTVVAVFILIPAIQGADPYLTVGTSTAALATLGIIVLQAIVAAAIVTHFRKIKDTRFLTTFLAPGIAVTGLIVAGYLIQANFHILTGSENALINALPCLLILVFAYGFARSSGQQVTS